MENIYIQSLYICYRKWPSLYIYIYKAPLCVSSKRPVSFSYPPEFTTLGAYNKNNRESPGCARLQVSLNRFDSRHNDVWSIIVPATLLQVQAFTHISLLRLLYTYSEASSGTATLLFYSYIYTASVELWQKCILGRDSDGLLKPMGRPNQ